MNSRKTSKPTKASARQNQKDIFPASKSSGNYSKCSSTLKKQVEQAKKKTVEAINLLASDPDITFCEFVKRTHQVSEAFRIMNTAIELGEQMKKLKGTTE